MNVLARKDNLTIQTTINEDPELIAIKGSYPRPRIVYSIKIGEYIVTSKNFSRKTWTTPWTAEQALIPLQDAPTFVKPLPSYLKTGVFEDRFFWGSKSYPDDIWHYSKPILTFHIG